MNPEADKLAAVLQSIIDGAVHPDVALRRISVDLAPIRAALEEYRKAQTPHPLLATYDPRFSYVAADRILKMLALTDRVAKLSDASLSTLVIEKVWGTLNLGSEQDALLDEMIRRFDAAKGIVRDEEEEIDQGEGYVIRRSDGTFYVRGGGSSSSLPDAMRWNTREAAEEANKTFVGATVVQVSPYPDLTQDEYDQIEQADRN